MKTKNIFLLAILFSSISIALNAQTLTDTTKMWAVNYQSFFPASEYTTYYKIGDTITITPNLYYEVLYATDSNHTSWNNGGYLRADLDKYYYKDNLASPDNLLYDFGLNTGDTILLHGALSLVVVTVDTVLFAGHNRKRITLEEQNMPGLYEYWYAGVGSDQGLLESGQKYIVGTDPELQCYWESAVLQFHNPLFTSCWNSSLVGENEIINFSIYPNPVNEILYLNTTSDIQIFDISGRKLIEQKESKAISVQSLSPGIYFLKTKDAQMIRFIKL